MSITVEAGDGQSLSQEMGDVLTQVGPDFPDVVQCKAAQPGGRGFMLREG